METFSLVAIRLRAERRRALRRGRAMQVALPRTGQYAHHPMPDDERLMAHVSTASFHPFMPLECEERWFEGQRLVWHEKLQCWVTP